MKVKEESEKVGLKLNIQKIKIRASGPITSWEIDGETVETVTDFILGGSKITADGDCSHEIKRCLLPGRKVMTNLDSILKSRDITLPTKAMVFPVVMYGCKSWTIMKAECRWIDAFELWCWRRLLRVPSIAGRSILNIHWKDICWSWNSNPLATWCEELTYLKRPWCWERLKAGGEGDDRGWDGCMASLTQWTWVWVSSGSSWWTRKPGMLQSMRSQRVRQDWVTELNWNWKGFPRCSVGKDYICNARNAGRQGQGKSPGVGNDNPFQYCCLKNLMKRSLTVYSLWGHKTQTKLKQLSTRR